MDNEGVNHREGSRRATQVRCASTRPHPSTARSLVPPLESFHSAGLLGAARVPLAREARTRARSPDSALGGRHQIICARTSHRYKECRSSSTSPRRSLARTPANLQTQTRRRLLARGPAPNYALVAAPRRSGGSGQACSDDASALLRTHQGRAGSGLARRRGWPRRSRRVGRRVATIVADHPVSRSTA